LFPNDLNLSIYRCRSTHRLLSSDYNITVPYNMASLILPQMKSNLVTSLHPMHISSSLTYFRTAYRVLFWKFCYWFRYPLRLPTQWVHKVYNQSVQSVLLSAPRLQVLRIQYVIQTP